MINIYLCIHVKKYSYEINVCIKIITYTLFTYTYNIYTCMYMLIYLYISICIYKYIYMYICILKCMLNLSFVYKGRHQTSLSLAKKLHRTI